MRTMDLIGSGENRTENKIKIERLDKKASPINKLKFEALGHFLCKKPK